MLFKHTFQSFKLLPTDCEYEINISTKEDISPKGWKYDCLFGLYCKSECDPSTKTLFLLASKNVNKFRVLMQQTNNAIRHKKVIIVHSNSFVIIST